MRELTITRRKSFVGCAGRLKVYIEDPAAAELIINNSPCRKLGDLKNGETKLFLIPSEACKIFVIAGRVSRNYCFDYYKLPAGEEPVTLTGKACFNLATGNAFRFDGVTDPQILADRKKGGKKGAAILGAAAVVGFAVGFILGGSAIRMLFNSDAEKTFSKAGMHITLDGSFKEARYSGYTVCYDSKNVAVFALKESTSTYPVLKNYTLREYANAVINNNNLGSSVKVKTGSGLTYFEYESKNAQANVTYHYYAVVYKTDDAFWMIQFATEQSKFENYRESIVTWAKSVTFQ